MACPNDVLDKARRTDEALVHRRRCLEQLRDQAVADGRALREIARDLPAVPEAGAQALADRLFALLDHLDEYAAEFAHDLNRSY